MLQYDPPIRVEPPAAARIAPNNGSPERGPRARGPAKGPIVMKRTTTTLLTAAALFAFGAAAHAQSLQADDTPRSIQADAPSFERGSDRGFERGFERGERPRRGGKHMKARMLEQFDADGDGELSSDEREAAKAFMQERKAEHKARLREECDANGDGVLSADERPERARGEGRRGKEGRHGKGRGGKEHRGKHMHKQALELFDVDGDGELNENEKANAKAFHEQRKAEKKAEMLERFDTDSDGQLSQDEREQAKAAHRERRAARKAELLERIDANGDGELTREEREAAKPVIQAERQAERAAKLAERRMDTNLDGQIDAADLAEALRRVADGSPTADYNGDGVVDALDAETVSEAARP